MRKFETVPANAGTHIPGHAGIAASNAPETRSASHQIVVGGQRVTMAVLLDLQRDAARYRSLRDKADTMACTAAPMVSILDAEGRVLGLIDGDDLDAAVDVAMARPKVRRPAASSLGCADRIKNMKDTGDAN